MFKCIDIRCSLWELFYPEALLEQISWDNAMLSQPNIKSRKFQAEPGKTLSLSFPVVDFLPILFESNLY